jgi:hypothetical protein
MDLHTEICSRDLKDRNWRCNNNNNNKDLLYPDGGVKMFPRNVSTDLSNCAISYLSNYTTSHPIWQQLSVIHVETSYLLFSDDYGWCWSLWCIVISNMSWICGNRTMGDSACSMQKEMNTRPDTQKPLGTDDVTIITLCTSITSPRFEKWTPSYRYSSNICFCKNVSECLE